MSDKRKRKPAPPTLNQRLAANIAAGRKSLGITQAVLAERLGVETETVSRFERGVSTPSLQTIERIAEVLGVTVSALLSEEKAEAAQ
jgi:transcriptional regulator with XRE-family HTH domain